MTGRQIFITEMQKRGMTNQQINSKVLAVALDILSDNEDLIFEMVKDLEDKVVELKSEIRRYEEMATKAETEYLKKKKQFNDFEIALANSALQIWRDSATYIAEWLESLKNCETAEGRDLMRKAQVFINSTDVNTKYDNTAYIIGLASILSGDTNSSPIAQLKKINPKLGEVPGDDWTDKMAANRMLKDRKRKGRYEQ